MLMNYVGFSQWLSVGASVLCLPYLRWKCPELPRPIRVHLFFPIIYLIMTLIITILPMVASPMETGIGKYWSIHFLIKVLIPNFKVLKINFHLQDY